MQHLPLCEHSTAFPCWRESSRSAASIVYLYDDSRQLLGKRTIDGTRKLGQRRSLREAWADPWSDIDFIPQRGLYWIADDWGAHVAFGMVLRSYVSGPLLTFNMLQYKIWKVSFQPHPCLSTWYRVQFCVKWRNKCTRISFSYKLYSVSAIHRRNALANGRCLVTK